MDSQARAQEILDIQLNAIKSLSVSEELLNAIDLICKTQQQKGKVILTGMGKAGIIGTKMSATLCSIAIPSFFVSPAEAAHGDIGRIDEDDLIIVFSNSGRTGEVVNMIHTIDALYGSKNKIISIGGNNKPLYRTDIAVSYGSVGESCVVSKVPSTSTTLMLILADMIGITAAESLGLDDSVFKARHPGGAIGKDYSKK